MSVTVIETLYHDGIVWCVSWSRDGLHLASCGGNKETKIWGFVENRWQIQDIIYGHFRSIRRVTWHPVITSLVSTCGFDGSTIIWEKTLTGFCEKNSLEGHESEVKDSTWDSSGRNIAICGRDKTIWIWTMDEDVEFDCIGVISAHSADVKAVKWHPRLNILASCSYDNDIRLHRRVGDDWESYQTLSEHVSTVWSLSFNKQGSKFVSCSSDGSVKLWEESGENQGSPLYSHVSVIMGDADLPIYSIDWSPRLDLIVWGGSDKSIHIYKVCGGQLEKVVCVKGAHDCEINCVEWNPRGEMVASAGDDGLIKLWELKCIL